MVSAPRLPDAFPGSLFINPLWAHVGFELSTDREWHSSSGTSSNGWDGSLKQVAWLLAIQRQE